MSNTQRAKFDLPCVSVLCTTYNQIQYIEECLNSITNQKTTFPFEIIIHDDCSTDGTTEFLRVYESKHNNVRVIYEKENLYSKGVKITPILINASRGRYLAFCECDDYYSDREKLQRQYEIMEKNLQCVACIHDAQKVNEQGKACGIRSPRFKDTIQQRREILYCVGNLYALNSLFVRKESINDLMDDRLYVNGKVGDIPIALHLSLKGDFYYINRIMSSYRVGAKGSWSKRMKIDSVKALEYANSVIDILKEYDKLTDYCLHDDVLDRIEVFEYQRVQQQGNLFEALSPRFRKRFLKSPMSLKLHCIVRFFQKRMYINGK